MRVRLTAALIGALIVIGTSALAQTDYLTPEIRAIMNGTHEEPKTEDRLAEECPEGRDIRTSDLCAQWKAADAAKVAADAATDSADYASEANKLAGQSNIIAAIAGVLSFIAMIAALAAAWYSRRTLRDGRAWLVNEIPELIITYRDINGEKKDIHVITNFKCVNTGRSPALQVRSACTIVPFIDGETAPAPPTPDPANSIVIGPDQSVSIIANVLNEEDVERYMKGEITFCHSMVCVYEDIYHPGTERKLIATWEIRRQRDDVPDKDGRMRVPFELQPLGSITVT